MLQFMIFIDPWITLAELNWAGEKLLKMKQHLIQYFYDSSLRTQFADWTSTDEFSASNICIWNIVSSTKSNAYFNPLTANEITD